MGQRLFAHSDNLSATLQSSSLSAADAKHLASLTGQVLEKIRRDESFKAFFETILRKKHPDVSPPEVPRRRKTPARFETGTGAHRFPETPEDLFRKIYFET